MGPLGGVKLRNLKLVKLLEFEVEAFFMSNCNKKFIGFGNMHVLFNMLPCGTPLEIIRNFLEAQMEDTAYRKYFYVLLSLSSYVFRHS